MRPPRAMDPVTALRRRGRPLARFLAALLVAELALPAALLAQDLEFATDAERDAYIAEVQSDLAVRQHLESSYTTNQERLGQSQQHLSYWQQQRNYPPPAGEDPNKWRQHVESQIQKFERYTRDYQEHVARTTERLQTQYQRIDRHQERIRNTRDDIVKQNLGTLMGVAGMAAAPIIPRVNSAGTYIPGRITAGEVGGLVRHGARVTGSAAIGNIPTRLQNAGTAATNWGNASRAAREALPVQGQSGVRGALGMRSSVGVPSGNPGSYNTWVAVPRGAGSRAGTGPGFYELQQVRMVRQANGGYIRSGEALQTVKTEIPVNVRRGNNWVKSEHTQSAARSDAAARQSATQAQQRINDIRLRAQEAAGTKAGERLTRTADRLQAKQDALNQKVEQYRADNKGHWANRAKQIGASAAKWAIFSMGVAVTSRAVEEYRTTGSISAGYVLQDLKTKEFWGGTAGSFAGSMLASGIASALPGGAFVRTAAAIGGAALGWQVGSGNLANTDWTHLGATTLGATIGSIAVGKLVGMVLGSAFGPLGTILGGFIGHFVADYLLRKVRDWAETPSESWGGREEFDQAGRPGGPGRPGDSYAGGAPFQQSGRPGGGPNAGQYGGPGSVGSRPVDQKGYGGGEITAAKASRDQAYANFIAANEGGNPAEAAKWYQEFKKYDQQIRAGRYGR